MDDLPSFQSFTRFLLIFRLPRTVKLAHWNRLREEERRVMKFDISLIMEYSCHRLSLKVL